MLHYYFWTAAVVLVTLALGLYIKRLRKGKRYWAERGIPYDESMNFISNAIWFMSKPSHELLQEQYKKHGRLYGSFEFRQPILNVCEPDLLRDILVKDFQSFSYRRVFDLGDDAVNKMVSILNGEDWKRVRTIMTPAFTSRKMRQISHIISDCTKIVNEIMQKHSESGEPIDCKRLFGGFTLDVIARAAFATKIDSIHDPENDFVKNAKVFFGETPILRFMAATFLPSKLLKFFGISLFPIGNFFKDVISQVIKERKETGKKYNDILQLLLDAQDELEDEKTREIANTDDVDQYGSITSDEMMPRKKYRKLYEDEVLAQCILFFMAGYETTASTMSYLVYLLALNPECQEKIIAEVDEVFKKHKEVDYDVIREMKYLDCAISETLRMYPLIVRADRTATEDYKLGNTGLTIEKGTLVGFNIHAMQHDPEFFPNPEKFEPERFLSGNSNHPQYAYLPFGAGPRNCLGMRFALMEMKLCISNILRFYRFKKATITEVPLQYRKVQGMLVAERVHLAVERRH